MQRNWGIGISLAVLLLAGVLSVNVGAASDQDTEPFKFFREYVGLNDGEINNIRSGKPVAKILSSPTPDEVYVFGSVYVNSTPQSYLKFASDIDALRKVPNYLAIQKFSDPPKLSDLEGFTLEEQDIKELKKCEPGHCEVQLPSEAMGTFKKSVNWSAPDVADQVNRLGQKMALEALERYIEGGNAALGTYRDKHNPAVVADTFQRLLSRSKGLPVYLPALEQYLLNYPKADSNGIESQSDEG